MSNDELYHHGIKGQKWGVRRYQNYDGSLTDAGRRRYGKKENVGQSSPDMVLSKDTKLYRYANKKETGSLKGAYVFQTPSDSNEYYLDAKNIRLGFKDYDKIMATRISLLDDVKVRSGENAVKDVVDKIGKTEVTEAYQYLKDIGFLDSSKSAYDRSIIWEKAEKGLESRKKLGTAINRYTYSKETSKDTRNKLLDEYASEGYDAIVDPEDFVWNYERPMIIVNESKFKRDKQATIYDKSLAEHEKWAAELENEGKNPLKYEWSEDERRRLLALQGDKSRRKKP